LNDLPLQFALDAGLSARGAVAQVIERAALAGVRVTGEEIAALAGVARPTAASLVQKMIDRQRIVVLSATEAGRVFAALVPDFRRGRAVMIGRGRRRDAPDFDSSNEEGSRG
jgi:hypothetical protein